MVSKEIFKLENILDENEALKKFKEGTFQRQPVIRREKSPEYELIVEKIKKIYPEFSSEKYEKDYIQ